MKVLFTVDLRTVVMALRRAGYSRAGRDSRSFRNEKFHVILIEIPNGVILELSTERFEVTRAKSPNPVPTTAVPTLDRHSVQNNSIHDGSALEGAFPESTVPPRALSVILIKTSSHFMSGDSF